MVPVPVPPALLPVPVLLLAPEAPSIGRVKGDVLEPEEEPPVSDERGDPLPPTKGGVKGIKLDADEVGVAVTPPGGVGVSAGVSVGVAVMVEVGVLVGSGVCATGVAVETVVFGVGVIDPARLCGDGLNERHATEATSIAAANASIGILMLDILCNCLIYLII